MAVVVLGLHFIGFFLLFAFVVPNHLSLGSARAFTVGEQYVNESSGAT